MGFVDLEPDELRRALEVLPCLRIHRRPPWSAFPLQAPGAGASKYSPRWTYVLDGGLCPLWKVAGALEWDVGPTLSMIEAEVVRLEQAEGRQGQENCIVKGGNQ
jgi:hypothetical protein